MLGNREMTFDDYRSMLRRRSWILVVATIVGIGLGWGASKIVPKRFKSETTVLVEQQSVPGSIVTPIVTQEMNARLITMQQQILSRTRLEPIARKFGLDKAKDGKPVLMEYVVDGLRKAVVITPVRPISGSESRTLPGFTISVTLGTAELAQQVCEEIATEFIKENLSARSNAAAGTTDFLQSQLATAKQALDEQDAKLAAFQRRYMGALPGDTQSTLALLSTAKSQLDAATSTLSRAQQDKTYAEAQLQQQLAAWQTTSSAGNPQTLDVQLAEMQRELVTLEARYTPEHPDVIKKKNDIAQLRRRIDNAARELASGKSSGPRTPTAAEPAQVSVLRNQIHQLDITIKEKSREQDRLTREIGGYQGRIQSTPMVEQGHKDLTRDYNTALEFYESLKRKKDQAEMAQAVELRNQGEQFRVMDPPRIPEQPITPPAIVFVAGGLAAGMVFGLAAIVLVELQDKSLRTQRDVESLLQVPALAVVPMLNTKSNGRSAAWAAEHRSITT